MLETREQHKLDKELVAEMWEAATKTEREACARIADGYVGADPIADAIRMRSNG